MRILIHENLIVRKLIFEVKQKSLEIPDLRFFPGDILLYFFKKLLKVHSNLNFITANIFLRISRVTKE